MMNLLVGVLQHAALVHALKELCCVLLGESLSEGLQHDPKPTGEHSRDLHPSTRRRMVPGKRTGSLGACVRRIENVGGSEADGPENSDTAGSAESSLDGDSSPSGTGIRL